MEKIFELTQDTPMWVFNPDDPGCGLRATEVKPKLDRYLIKKLGKEKLSKWFIGETNALDYKMSFRCDSYGIATKKDRYPLFFANMGKGTKKKLMMFKRIKMVLYSKNYELINTILNEKNISSFFACHSFGMRQSKGFGCFYLTTAKDFDDEEAKYYFKVPVENYDDYETLFKYIEYFHKMLRSGINEYKGKQEYIYGKSLMYYYAKSKGISWDKPVIRNHFEEYNPVYKEIISSSERKEMRDEIREINKSRDRFLFRDALGLSSIQSWKKYSDEIKIKSTDDKVSRFKSPILYRPVYYDEDGYFVYIYLEDYSPEIVGKLWRSKFVIKNKNKYRKPPLSQMSLYSDLKDLTDYFDNIIKNRDEWLDIYSNENLCQKDKDSADDIIDVIYEMFDSLKKN